MPFTRPTLTELISRIQSDIESRLPGTDPRLRRAALSVLARTLSGAAHGLYGYLDWLADQILPDTADTDHLDRWASIWGLSRKAATAATGSASFTGTDGAVIPAGATLQRSDGGEFTLDADATVAAGTLTAAVTGSVAGTDGNTAAGSSLTLVNPIAGINSTGTVAAGGFTGGTDTETDDELRARLLARLQQPPHGGASFDYVAWALEVSQVTRAWVFPERLGAGTVGVSFVCDDLDPIIPTAAVVAAVQDHLNLVRPVTAQVTAFAPTPVAVNFTLTIEPNQAAVQAAVEAELRDLLIREAQPDDGAGSGTILLSHIQEAISLAAGETDHTLVAPAANVTLNSGEMAVFGAITWQ